MTFGDVIIFRKNKLFGVLRKEMDVLRLYFFQKGLILMVSYLDVPPHM